MASTIYPPAINLLLQKGNQGVKTVSKSLSGGQTSVTESSRQRRAGVNDAEYSGLNHQREALTWTLKPDYASSNPAIAPP